MVLGGTTDNRGNSFASAKLMTTKFPLVVLLMELAAQCHQRNIKLNLHWAPREQNCEADELSEGIFRRFDLKNRVEVKVESLDFLVLREMMAEGEALYEGLATLKATKRRLDDAGAPQAKRRRKVPGSALEPW